MTDALRAVQLVNTALYMILNGTQVLEKVSKIIAQMNTENRTTMTKEEWDSIMALEADADARLKEITSKPLV